MVLYICHSSVNLLCEKKKISECGKKILCRVITLRIRWGYLRGTLEAYFSGLFAVLRGK